MLRQYVSSIALLLVLNVHPAHAWTSFHCQTVLEALPEFVTAVDEMTHGNLTPENSQRVFRGLVRAGPVLGELNDLTGFGLSLDQWRAHVLRAAGIHLSPSDHGHSSTPFGRHTLRLIRRGAQVLYDPMVTLERRARAAFDNDRLILFPSDEAAVSLRWTEAEAHEEAHAMLELQLRRGEPSPYHLWFDVSPQGSTNGHEAFAHPRGIAYVYAQIRGLLARNPDVRNPVLLERVRALKTLLDARPHERLANACRSAAQALREGRDPSLAILLYDSPGLGPWFSLRTSDTHVRMPLQSSEGVRRREQIQHLEQRLGSAAYTHPDFLEADRAIQQEILRRLDEMDKLATQLAAATRLANSAADEFLTETASSQHLQRLLTTSRAIYSIARRSLREYTPIPQGN